MDDLGQPLVAQRLLDLGRLGAADLAQLPGVIVDEPPRELRTIRLGQRDHFTRAEIALDADEARGKEALAPLSSGLPRARANREPALGRAREGGPALPGGQAIVARETLRAHAPAA